MRGRWSFSVRKAVSRSLSLSMGKQMDKVTGNDEQGLGRPRSPFGTS